MTDKRAITSPQNGRRGGRKVGYRKPIIECTCGRSDGTHAKKCRITQTLLKRAQREKNKP